MKQMFILTSLLLLVVACNQHKEEPQPEACSDVSSDENVLQTGDLVFIAGDSDMDEAIMASTGYFIHTAVVDREGDSLYFIGATPSTGVVRQRYDEFCRMATFRDSTPSPIYGMRVERDMDMDKIMTTVRSHIGEPYDSLFQPDNGRVYCSELITEAYYDKNGEQIFATAPMNFKDADGTIPDYWTQWFAQLGVEIPQGVMGSNPSDMFHDPNLKMIYKK